MADVLDIDNAEEFEVDDDGDRKFRCTSSTFWWWRGRRAATITI